MAVKWNWKSSRLSALALAVAALTLPGAALANPENGGGSHRTDGDRAERSARGEEYRSGGWQQQRQAPSQGGWTAPQQAPAPPPPPQVRAWQGNGGNDTGWNGQRGTWGGGNAQTPPPAPAQGNAWSGRPRNWTDADRGQERSRDGERWRERQDGRDRDDERRGWNGRGDEHQNGWNNRGDERRNGWSGWNNGYRRDDDRRWDHRWDRRWRDNNRYDWHAYRNYHPDFYRLRPYYAPYRGYSYRRLSIGFFLDQLFFGRDYWIADPWQYRLPDVYGPYRWVRYYDDALLVNIYSGEVVDVIYRFFW